LIDISPHHGAFIADIANKQADKLHMQSQLEQLQARYVGIGHADIIKYDWAANIHRDTLSSCIGHPPISAYFALAEGENIKRVQYEFMEKMIRPVGNPPIREE
jgi:splicing factor 3B subunit 5